jgi:hypothetical protein
LLPKLGQQAFAVKATVLDVHGVPG